MPVLQVKISPLLLYFYTIFIKETKRKEKNSLTFDLTYSFDNTPCYISFTEGRYTRLYENTTGLAR